MSNVVSPSEGLGVLHLFCKARDPREGIDVAAVTAAVDAATKAGIQVIAVEILGHKADLAFMVLGPDWRALRRFQSGLQHGGLEVVDSYVSLTEISEYAAGVPEEMRNMRLYPELPPDDKPAWCFYPMSKRRNPGQNWFTTDFETRKELMLSLIHI